jgi:hypothetical protein
VLGQALEDRARQTAVEDAEPGIGFVASVPVTDPEPVAAEP